MSVLGLINARGGSKGVPRKNIRPLGGKPLIQYAVEVGRKSPLLADVIVSTDDSEIASIASDAGAEVPFMRPPELATDDSPQIDTVLYVLDRLAQLGRKYEYVVLLQPTCPFRIADDVQATFDLACRSVHGYAFSATGSVEHPHYQYWLTNDVGTPVASAPGGGTQRQQYRAAVIRNGAVYIATVAFLRKTRTFYGPEPLIHVMPPERSVNIDTPRDWMWAEFLLDRGLVRP